MERLYKCWKLFCVQYYLQSKAFTKYYVTSRSRLLQRENIRFSCGCYIKQEYIAHYNMRFHFEPYARYIDEMCLESFGRIIGYHTVFLPPYKKLLESMTHGELNSGRLMLSLFLLPFLSLCEACSTDRDFEEALHAYHDLAETTPQRWTFRGELGLLLLFVYCTSCCCCW